MKRTSLFKKIVLVIVPLIVITAVLTWSGVSLISQTAFLNTIRSDFSLAAALASRQVESYLNGAFQDIQAAAGFATAVRLDNWRTKMALAELRQQFPQFQQMSLVDPEGRETASGELHQDLGNTEAHLVFLKAKAGRLAYSQMVLLDRVPVLFVAAPVFYDGNVVAVVWGRLNVKPVWDLVIQLKRDLNLGSRGHVYLLDDNGALVGSDDMSRGFGSLLSLPTPPETGPTPDFDIDKWRKNKEFDTYNPEILKSLLKDRNLAPDFWIAEEDGIKTIFLRSRIQGPGWTLFMTQPYYSAFSFLYQALWASLSLALVLTMVAVGVSWITTKRILGPVTKLHWGVSRAAHGDFSQPIIVSSRDEVGELASHFNEMQKSLQDYIRRLVTMTTDLNHAKNLAVLGTTASKVNHQVGNFLNNLVLALSILKTDTLSEPSRVSLEVIEENTRQIQMFIERLMNFARRADLSIAPWSPTRALQKIVDSYQDQALAKGVVLTLKAENTSPVLADGVLLEQALVNLLTNALDALGQGGILIVSCGMDGDRVKMEVNDNGPGIPQADLENVFTPFFTTKKTKGTGLGLALAQTVIQAHGGEIVLNSQEGQGVVVTCWLPAAPPALRNESGTEKHAGAA
jgi:signal transduction histidine kinase